VWENNCRRAATAAAAAAATVVRRTAPPPLQQSIAQAAHSPRRQSRGLRVCQLSTDIYVLLLLLF